MRAYLVKSPVRHDGIRFAPGSTIDLSDDDARPLLERGRIEPAKAKPAPKPDAPADKSKSTKAKTEE